MDYLLTIVKFASLILAAAFAILGTTTDFKKKGKMTKWGRIAIIGVIVSGLVSSVLLGLEESTKATDKKKAEEEKIAAQNKANDEKAALYEKFDNLFKNTQESIGKTQENIEKTQEISGKTGETLNQTRDVAKDVKNSVRAQRNLATQTQDISNGVKKNVEGQNQLITQSRVIAKQQREIFDKASFLQQQQQNLTLDASRLLFPLSQFAVSYELKFPLRHPAFKAYLDRLIKIAETDFKPQDANDANKESYETGNEDIYVFRKNNKLDYIQIREGSRYFPLEDKSDEKGAVSVFNKTQLYMNLYKEGADKKDVEATVYAWGSTKDLKNSLARRPVPEQRVRIEIEFSPEKEGIYMNVFSSVVYLDFSTNQLVGFQDLPGSWIDIFVPCESAISFFSLRTGSTYGIEYSLPAKEFEIALPCLADPAAPIKFDIPYIVKYQFKKSDFKIL